MKFRKSNNFFSESKNILSQYGSNDRKNFNAALSTQYSSKQTTSRSHAILPINTCSSLTPQGQNFTTFSNTPSDTSKRAIFENQNQTNLTYSTKTTEPKVKSNQEYIPFNSRVNIIEHLSNRDDFEEYMNQKENENEHYFVEPLESPRKDQKHQSIEKNSEEREGNSENMGGSLGSTILPRTNNCSGFNETFENLIVDNKLQEERRLSEITISNSYQSKNYDLPLS